LRHRTFGSIRLRAINGGALRAEIGEDAALRFWRFGGTPPIEGARAARHPGRLADDLGDPITKRDPASLGEGADRIVLGVVSRHILGSIARERSDKHRLIGEVVAAVAKRDALPRWRESAT